MMKRIIQLPKCHENEIRLNSKYGKKTRIRSWLNEADLKLNPIEKYLLRSLPNIHTVT